MRRAAWPGVLAAVAWGWFLVAASVAHASGGAQGIAVVVLAAGSALGVAAWSAARGLGATAEPTAVRLAAAVAGALLLGAYGLELVLELGSSSVDVGLETPLTIQPLLPGPSEAWVYVAALGLTVVSVASSRRAGLLAGAAVSLGAIVGGGLLVARAAGTAPSFADDTAGGCRDPFTVLSAGMHSFATGDVGGASLGRVVLHPNPEEPSVLVVDHDTRWGSGRTVMPAPTSTARDPLEAVTLRPARLAAADDLGIDLVGGRAARHCRIQTEGPAAVAGFPALRWLVGADETTPDPGTGLELWRGTVDYWLVTTRATGFVNVDVFLATTAVDGQPPRWPVPGLHATLRAASSYGEPSPGGRLTE